MWKYIIKRLLGMIPIVIVVSFLVFSLMSLAGDPVYTIVGDNATEAEIETLRESMGLNDPLLERYGRYMAGVLQGDLGISLYGRDVWTDFITRLPYTVALALLALLITVVISVPLGILSALKQNTWIDSILSGVAMLGLSVPGFWLGLMLMLIFAVQLGWLPTSGASAGLKSIILPAVTASCASVALLTRMTRSSMLDCTRSDYLRTARAKGASEQSVILRHALGNALIPVITTVGSQFSTLVGGSVAIEMVFGWPGIGSLIINAVRGNDFTVVTGCVMLTTILVAMVLLVIDILYAFVDPRIKAQYTGK